MNPIAYLEDSNLTLEELIGQDTEITVSTIKDPESPLEQKAVDEQATMLGVNPVEVSEARAVGDLSHEALANQYPDYGVFLESLRVGNVPVDEAAELLSAYKERVEAAVTPQAFIFKSMLLTDDEEQNGASLNIINNYERLHSLLAKEIEAEDPSYFKWIAAGTADFFRDFTVGAYEMITKDDQDRSEEYARSLSLPRAEFEAYWLGPEGELEKIKRRGFFNSREYGELKEARELLDNFGTDKDASFKQLMGILTIATMATPYALARGAVSGTRVLSTSIAREGVYKAGVALTKGAKETVKNVMAARTASEAITAVRGPLEGARATVIQLNSRSAPDNVAGRAGPSTLDPFQGPLQPINVPHLTAVVEGTNASMIFEKLSKLMRSPVTGRPFSADKLRVVTEEATKKIINASNKAITKLISKPALTVEGSDSYIITATLGDAVEGGAFSTKEAAMAAVKNNTAYKVVEAPRVVKTSTQKGIDRLYEVEDGVAYTVNKKGYYLEYSERIDTRRLADELEDVSLQESFLKRSLAGLISAPQTALGARLGFLINASENVVAKAGQFADQAFKDVRNLAKAEFQQVEAIMLSYRDGLVGDIETGLSALRGAPTETEFVQDFFGLFGSIPTENQVKAYRALTDLNNASWNIKATDILKRVAEREGRTVTVTEGYDTIGVLATGLPDDVIVFSRLSGPFKGSQAGERIIYKLDEPFEAADGIVYDHVTDVLDSRVPVKSDVLGYNVGGPRNNDNLRHFIGTVYNTVLAGGREIKGGFRTLLGSFSRKEADVAAFELNQIQKALLPLLQARKLKGIKELTLSGADLTRINNIIARNNTWNPSVADFNKLKIISNEHGESFANTFVVKARDEAVDTAIPEGAGLSVGEYQAMRVTRKRGDTPPMTYGGGQAINQSPIQNIVDQFKSEAYRYSHYKATQSAVNGWVKKAGINGNVTFDGAVPVNPEDFIRQAKVKNNTKLDAEMMQQQRAIKSRLGLLDRTDTYTVYARRFAEAVYDTTALAFGKGQMTKPEDWIGGAAGKARAMAFHMKMGLGNPDQFVLNASHVAQITMISPKYGLKAAPNVPIIAALLYKTRKAADADISKIVKETTKEKGGLLMTEQELIDTVRYLKETGRDRIGATTLERNGATFNDKTTVMNEFLEVGLTPFKGGELYGRITATAVAVMEHNAQKLSNSVFSSKGIQYVSNREQALTFRMTSGQKGRYQENSIAALATQWQSYSLRFVDNVLIGRDLNGKERTRLALLNPLLFGLRGVGFPPRAVAGIAALGIDPEDENAVAVLNRVKFGLFDEALSLLVGQDVSLGTRIGPLNGTFQQYSDMIAGDTLLDTFGGPSVQIGTESLASIRRLWKARGEGSIAFEELKILTRGVKSFDMYFKIKELIETGQYRSKRRGVAGTFSDEEISVGMVASLVAGATPMRVLNLYDAKDISYGDDRKYKDARKAISGYADRGLELIRTGDPDKMKAGNRLYQDALDLIEAGGFSDENQHRLKRSIINIDTTLDLIKQTRGQSTAAQLTAKAAQGE
tara:strand:+ start:1318 stop:5919 length:4602 start_codon:yes stop_codon:yes gene_type:complete